MCIKNDPGQRWHWLLKTYLQIWHAKPSATLAGKFQPAFMYTCGRTVGFPGQICIKAALWRALKRLKYAFFLVCIVIAATLLPLLVLTRVNEAEQRPQAGYWAFWDASLGRSCFSLFFIASITALSLASLFWFLASNCSLETHRRDFKKKCTKWIKMMIK